MKIELNFTDDMIQYLQNKFDIDNEEDLEEAIWEMIRTYMEL